MATSFKEIRNERQWKAMTGLSQQEFTSLSTAFEKCAMAFIFRYVLAGAS